MGKKEIKESRYFKTSYLSGIAKLEVNGVYPEDQGEYLCVAENDAGRAQSKCDVTVLGKSQVSVVFISNKNTLQDILVLTLHKQQCFHQPKNVNQDESVTYS